MKKFTLSIACALIGIIGAFAESVTIWEGNLESDLKIFKGTDVYDKFVANAADGDVLVIHYSGATEGNKLWLQNSAWDTYAGSLTGVTTDVLNVGDGTYSVNLSDAFLSAVKEDADKNEGGLRLRRGGNTTYAFTKVEITKGEQKPGDDTPVDDGITLIWEGSSSEGNLYFAPESTEWNKIFGDGKNQANVQPGDKLRFYYTGAENDSQIWIQANWDGLTASASTPTLPNGDGMHEFALSEGDIEKIRTAGIRFRRPDGAVYTLTRIEIVKEVKDPGLLEPGSDEKVLWSGNETGDYTLSFRYDPSKSALVAAISPGMSLNVYLSNVKAGDHIYIKECKDWSYLNDGATELAEGQQVYSLKLTADMVSKITDGGLVYQQHDSDNVYGYTFRYVTVSTDIPTTGISNVTTVRHGVDRIFNLAGQAVSKNYKGIVIVNGKKVVK